MPKPRPRYERSLTRFKLRYFETVSAIVVLALFTQFAYQELRPLITSVLHFFRAP